MSAQLPPVPAHRCHWYAKVGEGEPVQLPLLTVSVWSSWAVPPIDGAAVFLGAEPVAWTTSVGREVAVPEPSLLVAVTTTRSRFPTSVVWIVYWRLLAPLIGLQPPPCESQRSHW